MSRECVVSKVEAWKENKRLHQICGAHLVHDKDAGDLGELGQALEHFGAELVPSPLVRDIHKDYDWKKLEGWGEQRYDHSFPHPPKNFQGMSSGQAPPPNDQE